jgi:septal ring factor EnvC (AmiA/AmiB activator)
MPKTPTLMPAQAAYVVERLIAERKLTATDINQYLQGLQAEIQSLEQRIEALRSHAPAATPNAAPATAKASGRKHAAHRRSVAAERRDTRAALLERSPCFSAPCR